MGDQVLKKINLSEFADLPLPALFNKIKSKMKEKQNRQELQRKYKKMRMDKLTQKQKENEEDRKENKRLEKQQKRRQKLLKEKKSKLDDQILADDVLLNNQINGHKHNNVAEIELSDSEQHTNKEKTAEKNGKKGLDLDSFIEDLLDGIGGNDWIESSEEEHTAT